MADEEMFQAFLARRGQSIILNEWQIKAYDIRTITLEQFRMLIACGNDSRNNQIRVTKTDYGEEVLRIERRLEQCAAGAEGGAGKEVGCADLQIQ